MCYRNNSQRTLRHSILAVVAMLLCSMFVAACSTGDGSTSDVKEEKQSSLIDIYTVGDSDTVYICTGKASKRFHSSDTCEGIMQCTKEITPVTRADAESRHRTFCHKCYRDSLEQE